MRPRLAIVSIAIITTILGGVVIIPAPAAAAGASLLFSPNSGSYLVGSTVDVALILNTNNQAVNAVRADVTFPADKLQVVNPSASTSFIKIWINQPSYSNTAGTLSFQGGLPSPGITTSNGIISTITFRVIAPGTIQLGYKDTSQVLLNDGGGTNVLQTRGIAQFTTTLPPPAGPVTQSTTHEDPTRWYASRNAAFSWGAVADAVGYSFIFDQRSNTVPDEKVDTTDTSTTVTADQDGQWYFHIRAKTTVWGGTTHVLVNIDNTAPATFSPTVDTGAPADKVRPVVTFVTTDAASGIDHYEVRFAAAQGTGETPFFVEQASPYQLPELAPGDYEIVVRAFDKAGNSTDGTTSFTLTSPTAAPVLEQPLFKTTLITNIALIALGVIALAFVAWLIWRRINRRKVILSEVRELGEDIREREAELLRTIQEEKSLEQSLEHTTQDTNTKGGIR